MAMSSGAAAPQVHPLKAGLEDVVVSTSEICFSSISSPAS